MDKNTLVLASAAVIILLTGLFFVNRGRERTIFEEDTVTESETLTEEVIADESSPDAIVDEFLANFTAAAPPATDEDALENALAKLSDGAKMDMSEEPTSGDLAQFVGVQDVPDEGYEIGDVSLLENEATGQDNALAEVEVTLNYSAGETVKIFVLSRSENVWLIDAVR